MNTYVVAIHDGADSDTFLFKRKTDAEAFAEGAVLERKSRGYVEDEMTKNFRLALTNATLQVLKNAFGLLGIGIPDKM